MDLQTLLLMIFGFLNGIVIPLIFAIAVLFFVWNATRYFIIGGANEDDQEKARRLAIWGILAFVVITALWGIVALISGSLDVNRINFIEPDYKCEKQGDDCIIEQRGDRPGDTNYIFGDPVDRDDLDDSNNIIDETSGAGDGDLGDIPFTG